MVGASPAADALERLVPKAIRVLEEQLDSGRPDAWRSALRLLEYSWGRPPEHVEVEARPPESVDDLDKMSTAELTAFVSRGGAKWANLAATHEGLEHDVQSSVGVASAS